MDHTQTPTPEQEMREIFANTLSALSQMRDKVISTVVAHSQTARELADLRERFEELSRRMTSVVDEAQRVRQDLHMTIVERDKYKREADDNLALAQGYEKERDEARQRLSETQSNLAEAQRNLDDANREKSHANAMMERLRSDLEWTQQDRNRYRNQADEALQAKEKAEAALKEANERLTKLQDTFRSIFPEAPKLEEAKPVELPGTAPSFLDNMGQSNVGPTTTHKPEVEEPDVQAKGVNERIDQAEEEPWWKKRQDIA